MVVAFAFASVAVLVFLPLLGYKIDIIVAAAEELLGPKEDGGYEAVEYTAPTEYEAPEGYARSLQTSVLDLSSRVYNR